MFNEYKHGIMYYGGEILEYLSKPIFGIVLGLWGVWLGLFEHYLGNANGIAIMLVGIACLVLASITINVGYLKGIKAQLEVDVNEYTVGTTYKADKNTYITK